ncbi:hypothetical protein [Carboxylicivirga linearis]|uniref:DUF4374 domain-containing protein n=1 Tax=Carboxylicivirga linearis TaxID=1628157 RepID=A0ABS5K1H5_9BACT|nr:hypothetical protein [Carboxylicivirga linearis]MBS2101040.1 hypothetical protein [Carboxylicivirga linearis]
MIKSKLFYSIMLLSAAFTFSACEDESNGTKPGEDTGKTFHIGAKFDDDDSQVFLASTNNLEEGSLSFVNNGYHLNPVRSARVFTDNSDNIYVFNYGGGDLQRLTCTDGIYTKVDDIDVTNVMGGTAHVRPWKINEETILIHNINAEDIEDSGNGVIKKPLMYSVNIDIPALSIHSTMETWEIEPTEWDIENQAYPFRVDAPTVLDNKIYYGVGRRLFDGDADIKLTGMHTIVLDYPSLTNPKYIRTEKGHGNTNGYRGENMHAIDGYVYQANRAASAEDATMLLRLQDGEYDEDWEFNITEALGRAFNTNNWYHAGNGICYMSAQFFDAADENNDWGVIRIDIYNKTAIQMNVPMSDLFGYQQVKVIDDKMYMAISPVGTSGASEPAIYIFDVNSDDPDAVTKGMTLDSGNIFVEGIY